MKNDLRLIPASPLNPKTNWGKLSWPYVCGLLSENPSRYSSTLHNAGFKALDLPFSYHGFSVQDITLPIQAMRDMRFRAYSVTIPFKEDVLLLLDGIGPEARAIGAVNTIINDGERLHGFNTDWLGVAESFREHKQEFKNESCLVLGAGGGAKAAVHALKKLGVGKICITNRTLKRARELGLLFGVDVIDSRRLTSNKIEEFSIIINCTPGYEIPYFPYEGINRLHTVLDMVTAETRLIKITQSKGAVAIPGIRMLLHQGLGQFKLFTEKAPPRLEMEKALIEYYSLQNKAEQ
ncbi:MAG TPA: shikimate dehydrogenase [Oligoflexia bacterium]|nr:shikimate dehydrogenase [Oligoflexia bacterium]HMP47467.1 shikimate dehydrogenase [Oligoflexia bacterium]